jgi:hypothetical protein
VPLVEGENVLTAVATGVTGQTVSGALTLNRKLVMGNHFAGDAKGGCAGCSTGVGLEALVALTLALSLRRRARR